MKKKIILILSSIFLSLIFIFSTYVLADKFIDDDIIKIFDAAKNANDNDKTIVAIVNGKKIYKETIDFLASGEDLSQKNSISAIGDSNSNSDKNSILQNQIRNIVVLSEAERLGLEASYEDAKKYTIENYELIKQIGGETYEIIKDYIEEMNLTEEEYLEKCTQTNQKMITRGNLYEHFIKDKTGTNEELLEQYEEYVNELIKKADIEYIE